MQGAEQVGYVQVQGLAVLRGQFLLVVTFGQVVQVKEPALTFVETGKGEALERAALTHALNNANQALQALRVVIEEYPDSEYAKSATLKFDLAFDHLAAKDMEIGRYYLKRGNFTAAINRFRAVVQDFQTTTHTAEALERLVEAYLALGLTDEAQTAGAILGFNYQSSPFYQDAFNLLKKQGLSPEAKGTSWLSQVYRQMIKGEWL